MSVQSTTSAPEPQLLTHSTSEVESKALTSAGSADYKGVVVERNGLTNSTGKSSSEALFRNATLATASGFSMGATDATVMAGIHEALSKLVNVDVTRRKLNRDLTFMEADNIAKKVKTAAELERKGAALALGMAVGGGLLSIGLGSSMITRGNKSATKIDLNNQKLKDLETTHTSVMKPMQNNLSGPDGAVNVDTFGKPFGPPKRGADNVPEADDSVGAANKIYNSGSNPDEKVSASQATRDRLFEVEQMAEGKVVLKDEKGFWKWKDSTDADGNAIKVPETVAWDDMTKQQKIQQFGPATGNMDVDELKRSMAGVKKKADHEIRLRSLVSGDGTKGLVNGKNVDHPVDVGVAQKQLSQHESKMAETGFQDQSIADQLKDLARADANLTAMTSMAQVPGGIVQAAGTNIADLTYNKEAKELEAEAARDGATQSFFSDNAGTLGSEIQGAMQGIDSVKAYIEVGASIAAGMRA